MSNDGQLYTKRHHSEPTLVAESIEPEDTPPELAPVQSYGGGFQLRRGIQDS